MYWHPLHNNSYQQSSVQVVLDGSVHQRRRVLCMGWHWESGLHPSNWAAWLIIQRYGSYFVKIQPGVISYILTLKVLNIWNLLRNEVSESLTSKIRQFRQIYNFCISYIFSCQKIIQLTYKRLSKIEILSKECRCTCLSVLATRLSITAPRSSCSRWTSSMINRRTICVRATSPVLLRVTTSHFSGVVTNI